MTDKFVAVVSPPQHTTNTREEVSCT